MGRNSIPVTVIGGYLGSGKTTLLNALLRGVHGLRLAVLVNDFGSINIDAELIAAHQGDTISLTNGCVCCSLRDNLGAAFYALSTRSDPPDHIVIEASGVADPRRIARYAQAIPGLYLAGIIVLADAQLIRKQARDKYVGDTVLQQLLAADLVVLSKTDLVTPTVAQEVRTWLELQAPGARIVEAVAGRIPYAFILGLDTVPDAAPSPSSLNRVSAANQPNTADPGAGHEHELAFDRFSFEADKPLERAILTNLLDRLPPAVVRAKGVLYLADTPDQRVILQMVGQHWRLEPGAPWGDELPATRLVLIAPHDQIDANALQAQFIRAIGEAGQA